MRIPNLEYLIKKIKDLLGTTSISSIGDGTVTGAISSQSDQIVNLGNYFKNIDSIRKNAGTMVVSFLTAGVQIDANRVVFSAQLPFYSETSDYTFTVTSGTILGVSQVPLSSIHIDAKRSIYIRMYFDHQGTAGTSYLCEVVGTLSF